MTRCFTVRLALLAMFGLLSLVVATSAAGGFKPTYGPGRCSKCSCPGFTGSGYTCTRGGCRHHYDSHY
jgi:hypothetical protein